MCRTQEYPLVGGRHLCARRGRALFLEAHSQTIQFHAKLPQMFILPDALVLRLWHGQDKLHIRGITFDQLLYILLHSQCAVHLLQRFIGPATEILFLVKVEGGEILGKEVVDIPLILCLVGSYAIWSSRQPSSCFTLPQPDGTKQHTHTNTDSNRCLRLCSELCRQRN